MPRLSFSQKMGLTPKEFPLQVDSLDDATRMDIWNAFYECFSALRNKQYVSLLDERHLAFCKMLWGEFLKMDLSKLAFVNDIFCQIKKYIVSDNKWNKIFDLCEYIIKIHLNESRLFAHELDTIFKNENVAYRVIGTEISPITDDQEIQAIKTAMELPNQLAGARTHISTALQLLSDRKNPDYRNSIKESISAVEAVCMVLVGDESASLGKALKHLEDNGIKIHTSLKNGFSNIYGYTSDQGGIRHAMIEEGSVVTQEDALFMLVSCSAFCHYLQQKGAQAGLLS